MFAVREDAVLTEFLGIRVYSFGLWIALGLLLAVLVLIFLNRRMKKPAGAAALQSVLENPLASASTTRRPASFRHTVRL